MKKLTGEDWGFFGFLLLTGGLILCTLGLFNEFLAHCGVTTLGIGFISILTGLIKAK